MDRLEQLKKKYSNALGVITAAGVSLQNLHVENDKLLIRGKAPSEEAKAEVWTAFKAVDAGLQEVLLDLTVDTSLPTPARSQSYTVQAGDSLSKISKQYYGDAGKYMKIFEANKDQLKDPNMIKAGQVLKIPSA